MKMDKQLKELENKIGKVPKIFEDLQKIDPELYKSVMALDQMVWADGALSKKTKKLIAVAIAASLRTVMRSGPRWQGQSISGSPWRRWMRL